MEAVICALNKGGRLIYAGAGTSGRLGILDAVECLPTFSTTDEVVGIMAGGEKAFVHAQEGVEDSKEEGRKDLEHLKVDERDVVVALSACLLYTSDILIGIVYNNSCVLKTGENDGYIMPVPGCGHTH